jgi:hypothetical protein
LVQEYRFDDLCGMWSSALRVASAVLRPSYTCCEVDRGGGVPSLVGVCCGRRFGSDQLERGMLVGGGLSTVVDLGVADGVSASGDRKRPSDVFGVCEDGVGFVQA